MKRLFIFALFFFSFSTAYAQNFPGTPQAPTFEEVFDRCVTNYSGTDLSFCVSFGFNYQTVETSFDTPNGYNIQFKSDIIESGAATLKVEHYGIKAFCTGCSTVKSSVGAEVPNLAADFSAGVSNAHYGHTFFSKLTRNNGSRTNNPTRSNNGVDWSERLKNSTDSIVDIWNLVNELFSENSRDGGFVELYGPDGVPELIIWVDEDGKYYVVAELKDDDGENLIDEDGNPTDGNGVSFRAQFPSSAGSDDFIDFVLPMLEREMECTIVFTGDQERMTAQVSCY